MDQPTTTPPDLDEFLGTTPQKGRSKYIRWGIIALVVLVLLWVVWRLVWGGAAATSYATRPVVKGDLTVTVSATGNLQPTNQVDVGSELSGLVSHVYVDNNDRVSKGQLLARIDVRRFQDALRQSQAQVAAAQASVAQAQATAQLATANLRRQEEVFRLSGGKVPSRTELDSARAEAARTQAGVRSAQAQVAQARAQFSIDEFQLSRASIVSPVNGVVLSRKVEPGQTVAASFNAPVLFTIAEDLSAMRLEVKVDEADVGQVAKGQRATFAVDAFPGRSFPATIERVDVGANASGTSAAASTTTASTNTVVAYTARLTVANPELVLRPGMTATADIVTTEKRNVLLVPNAALRFTPGGRAAAQSGGITSVLAPPRPNRRGGATREVTIGRGSQQTIYVVGEDGQPKPIQVTVGDTDGSVTEVSGDIQAGAKVITGQFAGEAGAGGGAGAGAGAGGGPGAGSGGQRRQGAGAPGGGGNG